MLKGQLWGVFRLWLSGEKLILFEQRISLAFSGVTSALGQGNIQIYEIIEDSCFKSYNVY